MKTKKNFFKVFVVLFLISFFSGCFNKKESLSENDVTAPSTHIEQRNLESVSLPVNLKNEGDKIQNEVAISTDNKRLIIRTGTINIEVENYTESEKKISEAAIKFSGFVTNTTSSLNAGGKKQGSINVRVPSEKFDSFISVISSLGKIMSENISGKDVTEEFIDLEARQKTQKELENRLLGLLTEKTASLVDVVEVEQKLASVRENIERTEGRMRFLKDQTAFSTLSISLFEPSLLQTSSGGGFFYEIAGGFRKGLKGFTEVLSGLITVAIAFLPILILMVLIYFIVRKIIRNRKIHKSNLQVQS